MKYAMISGTATALMLAGAAGQQPDINPAADAPAPASAEFDQHCNRPAASADGSRVVFEAPTATADEAGGDAVTGVYLFDRATARTILMSMTFDRRSPSANSFEPAISGDGQWIAFASDADDIEPGDTNNAADIFLININTRETTRVTRSFDFMQANGDSRAPRLSHDGRFLVFESIASNLVENDTNGVADIFAFDTHRGSITRLSTSTAGTEGSLASSQPAISGDGTTVVFASDAPNFVENDTNGVTDLFLHDLATGAVSRITRTTDGIEADGHSAAPALSADGQLVAFHSWATNLVNDDTNAQPDVFVLDRSAGIFTRISKRADGSQSRGPSTHAAISASGRYVSFQTTDDGVMPDDTNRAADIYVVDGTTGNMTRASLDADGEQGAHDADHATLIEGPDAGGFAIIFRTTSALDDDDTNGTADIVHKDLKTGEVRRVSTPPGR